MLHAQFHIAGSEAMSTVKIALDTFKYTTEEAATESLITNKASQNLWDYNM